MYPNYFGLKEPSFSITPDPQYLFLSEQHREALAHLLYGAGQGGGFVLLSGEVGTGKTTVCRAFLEQLPEGVDVALVVNPAMTAAELLHAICDEFRVELPPGEPSVKLMLDRLNAFLLDAHARGRRPVLIIDEAQNLRPKVMEQIRLLTNLETAKQKLLQIFLIGQPEVRTLLASPDLRQLNQRITARYHLTPLAARETAAYVDHRIAVAGVDRPLFTAAALKRVHRRSGGVPRLINLLCDRALLGAALSRRMQVTPDIVDKAAREVIDCGHPARARRLGGLGLAAAVLAALGLGVWIGAADLPQRLPQLLPSEWAAELGLPVADRGGVAGQPADAPDAQGQPQDDALASVAERESPGAGAGDARAALFAGSVRLQPRAGEGGDDPPLVPAAVDEPQRALSESAAVQASVPGDAVEAPLDVASPDLPEAIADGAVSATSAAQPDAGLAAGSSESVVAPASTTPIASASSTDASAETTIVPSPTAAPEAAAQVKAPTPRIAMARIGAPMQLPSITADELQRALVDRDSVVDELLRLWRIETAPGVRNLDCAAVPAFALACERSQGRWSQLRRFDRPAALKLALGEGDAKFVVIAGLDDEHALLVRDGAGMRIPIAELDERWSGDYLMLWRTPPFGGRFIGRTDPVDAVAWLRERLSRLPGSDLGIAPVRYDAEVIAAVRGFQQAQGLTDDGVAGPRTLIMLSNVLADLDVPRLSHSQ